VLRKLGHNVEWSLNIESELFIEFSLSWLSFPFINIDEVPLLVDSSMLIVNDDLSVLVVVVSLYI
jgi:hypothetical protein